MKFASVLCLSLVASVSTLRPSPGASTESVSVPFVFPEENFKDLTQGLVSFSSGPDSEQENVKIGLDYLASELKVTTSQLKVTDVYQDRANVYHVYLVRTLNGVPIVNQRAAVHVKQGTVVAYSASFDSSSPVLDGIQPPDAMISEQEAIVKGRASVGNLPFHKDVGVHHEWVMTAAGKMVYAYVFQVRNQHGSKWFELYVDAVTGQIVNAIDFVNKASYKVIARPNITPEDGFTTLSDPAFTASSPYGWNNDGSKTYQDTRGNNADVTLPSGDRPKATGNLDFDTSFNAKAQPSDSANARAAAVNLFYIANLMHDISFQYGFTEAAGNFQTKNTNGKGRGGDAVDVSAQSDEGTDNAYFSTPGDGQRPSMVMFLFTSTTPQRDGALENDVPIHEYTHGISNRMTGGAATGTCLRTTQAGSMGEGWSDTLAMYLLRKESDTRETPFTLGAYVINDPAGIRTYPYSTNLKVNPLTYADLAKRSEVHAGGEVWATVLNELYWNLVDKWGYSGNWFDATQKQGNIVALQLIFGGFANQPCNPTFLQARDAIVLADKLFYNNEHSCEIWKAFAKRGMGVKAPTKGFKNSFDVPSECSSALIRERERAPLRRA